MQKLSSERVIAEFFSLLSVETRIKLIRLLSVKTLCVNALARRLGMTQSSVSQHLRVLRNVKLVEGEKRGYFVHYRLTFKNLEPWQKEVLRILEIYPLAIEPNGSAACCGEKNMEKMENECNH